VLSALSLHHFVKRLRHLNNSGHLMIPLQLLREAITAVPSLRYALGVVGLVSVIAIAGALNVDYRVAVFGTPILLFLMIALVIFAKLSATASEVFRLPVIVLLWAGVILTVGTASMLITSAFFGRPIDLTRIFAFSSSAVLSANAADRPQIAFKVGIITSLTGESSYYGKVIANGIQLALRESNIDDNAKVQITSFTEDDKADADVASSIVERFTDKGVHVILGPNDSHCAAAAARKAKELSIPMVSPSATASYLTGTGNEYFFRANSSDGMKANELVDWMINENPTGFFLVIHEERNHSGAPILYGESSGRDVIRSLLSHGRPYSLMTYHRPLDRSEISMRIEKYLSQNKPSAIAILGRSIDTVEWAKSIRNLNKNLGIYLISPAKSMYTSSNLDGVRAVTDSIIENIDDLQLINFRVKYSAQYPSASPDAAIDQNATFGYDAANIVIAALRRVATKADPTALQSVEESRKLIQSEIKNTVGSRRGLISDGGFTENYELNFRPQRQILKAGTWVKPV
jgi:ABC-type branched-subunit amino acid transport system substrate-binding protein